MYFFIYFLRQSFDLCSTVVRQNILFLEQTPKKLAILSFKKIDDKIKSIPCCVKQKTSLKLLLKRLLFILFCVFVPKLEL